VVKYVGSIRVEDANGDAFNVHEFVRWQFLTKMRRFELDATGERVDYVDEHSFVIALTGESLKRVKA
jgi:hypothetical protein